MLRRYFIYRTRYCDRLLDIRLGGFEEFGSEEIVEVYERGYMARMHVLRVAEVIYVGVAVC